MCSLPRSSSTLDAAIAALPLFNGLGREAIAIIANRSTVRNARADEILWRAGETPAGLAIVLSGEVRVVQMIRGRLRAIHTEAAGGTLGEVPLFGGGTYPATAMATRKSTLLLIPRAVLFDVIRADPAFAFQLLERLATRLRHVLGRVEVEKARSVTGRLAAHLLGRYEAIGGNPITLGVTQQFLAEELGTVREVLVRSLRELKERRIIEPVSRGKYNLHAARLRQLLQEDNDA